MRDGSVEVHLKKATFRDIEAQASGLKELHGLYKSIRKVTSRPGDLTLNYDIRSGGQTVQSRSGLTYDLIQNEAARYRILQGIRDHIESTIDDVMSFDLAFDLSCRRVPDIFDPSDVLDAPAGGDLAGGGL